MPMIEITTGNSSAFAGYLASIPSYHFGCLGTCQKLAGGGGGVVGILNLGSEMR